MNVIMPEKSAPHEEYYKRYVRYIKNILLENKVSISYEGVDFDTRFVMNIDGVEVSIDYSDHPQVNQKLISKCKASFKFHFREEHTTISDLYPFAPTSFYDWKEYRRLKKSIKYTCNSDIVLNVQKPYGNAKERREYVRDALYAKYKKSGNYIYSPYYEQEDYWRLINDCLVHVFVPGCYNDMFDRGHIQYFAFGCCTISPRIVDILPFNKKIIPGIHYIECKSDYSDIVEKIEWSKKNRNKCREIGKNAQKLFEYTCTPKRLWKWILSKIDSRKNSNRD